MAIKILVSIKTATLSLLVSVLVAACSDPTCPEPFIKVGSLCKCPQGTNASGKTCVPDDTDGGAEDDAGVARDADLPPEAGGLLDAGPRDDATPSPYEAGTEIEAGPARDGEAAPNDARPSEAGPDECGETSCSSHGACLPSAGGPQCKCDEGFEGPSCANDIDECSRSDHGCSSAYPCENFAGGYTCQGLFADWPVPTHAPGLGNLASYATDVVADTVLDEVTGLMWQRRSTTGKSWTEAQSYCTSLEQGGYHDWRLPGAMEHASLLIPQQSPSIASVFVAPTSVWTASPSKRLSNQAWTSSENYGNTVDACESCTLAQPLGVRCVRTHQRKFFGTPTNRYVVDAQEKVVHDRATGLTWQMSTDDTAPPLRANWTDAYKHCESLAFAGVSDWRLPTAAELVSTMDRRRHMPAYAAPFEGASVYVWTRDESKSTVGSAMFVGQDIGHLHPSVPSAGYAIRCVRSGRLPKLGG